MVLIAFAVSLKESKTLETIVCNNQEALDETIAVLKSKYGNEAHIVHTSSEPATAQPEHASDLIAGGPSLEHIAQMIHLSGLIRVNVNMMTAKGLPPYLS